MIIWWRQEHVNIELDRVFGDDFDRPVTMADLSELKYLECCIKEALRICPSVPIFTRQLVEDITTSLSTIDNPIL